MYDFINEFNAKVLMIAVINQLKISENNIVSLSLKVEFLNWRAKNEKWTVNFDRNAERCLFDYIMIYF